MRKGLFILGRGSGCAPYALPEGARRRAGASKHYLESITPASMAAGLAG